MAFLLSDCYIGDYPITQSWNERPDIYQARFGMRGHNGIDIGCPKNTPILSVNDGTVYKTGFDNGGFGNFVKIIHQASDGSYYKSTYAHLNDYTIKKGDRVIKGQLIGHSGDSGFTDGAHLHFGVAPCRADGTDTEPNNGYYGYINPMGDRCYWEIRNPKEPVKPEDQTDAEPIKVHPSDFTRMVTEGTQYKVVLSYLLSKTTLNQVMSATGKRPLSLEHVDPKDGEAIVSYLAQVFEDMRVLSEAVSRKSESVTLATAIEEIPDVKKPSILNRLGTFLDQLFREQESK